jgi:hypothetical protein
VFMSGGFRFSVGTRSRLWQISDIWALMVLKVAEILTFY